MPVLTDLTSCGLGGTGLWLFRGSRNGSLLLLLACLARTARDGDRTKRSSGNSDKVSTPQPLSPAV